MLRWITLALAVLALVGGCPQAATLPEILAPEGATARPFSLESDLPAGTYRGSYTIQTACTLAYQTTRTVADAAVAVELTPDGQIVIDGVRIAEGVEFGLGETGTARVDRVSIERSAIVVGESGHLANGGTVQMEIEITPGTDGSLVYKMDSRWNYTSGMVCTNVGEATLK